MAAASILAICSSCKKINPTDGPSDIPNLPDVGIKSEIKETNPFITKQGDNWAAELYVLYTLDIPESLGETNCALFVVEEGKETLANLKNWENLNSTQADNIFNVIVKGKYENKTSLQGLRFGTKYLVFLAALGEDGKFIYISNPVAVEMPTPEATLELKEVNPFKEEIYVLYDAKIHEAYGKLNGAIMAIKSDKESLKNIDGWINLNNTQADNIYSVELEGEVSNKLSLQGLTPKTEYVVLAAILDDSSNFIFMTEPKKVTTTE